MESMFRRMAASLGCVVLLAAPAMAQRGRGAINAPFPMPTPIATPPQHYSGTVLSVDHNDLTIATTDRRVLFMTPGTKSHFFAKDAAGHMSTVSWSAFAPGDEVSVEAATNSEGTIEVNRAELEKKGDAEASQTAHDMLAVTTGISNDPIYATPSGDKDIDAALLATADFIRALPDFMVRQITTRYQAKNETSDWKKADTIAADLVTENNKETLKNITINGKKSKSAPEKSGAWSSGEFSSVAIEVLAPRSKAGFRNKTADTIGGRAAWRFDFAVDENHSHWILNTNHQAYLPGYSGAIWIDKETARVLRIEISTTSTPAGFPTSRAATVVELSYVSLGEKQFLMPSHAESLNCFRGTAGCWKNVIEYRDYRKFGAESSISFDKEPR